MKAIVLTERGYDALCAIVAQSEYDELRLYIADATLNEEELHTCADALDSHLYWQVNDDHTRRDSGYVLPPYTEEEQEVIDLENKLAGLLQKESTPR